MSLLSLFTSGLGGSDTQPRRPSFSENSLATSPLSARTKALTAVDLESNFQHARNVTRSASASSRLETTSPRLRGSAMALDVLKFHPQESNGGRPLSARTTSEVQRNMSHVDRAAFPAKDTLSASLAPQGAVGTNKCVAIWSPRDLHSRATVDTRECESTPSKDDTEQLLRLEGAAQRVDKDQSEVMHQQWSLLRQQVATFSVTSIKIRSEINDLHRVALQEETERRAAIEAVQADLRAFEERISRALEDLRRSQVSSMVDSALRDALEGKLEQSCKTLRADVNQALDEAHAGLKSEVSALSRKKDALEKATKEMQTVLQKEVNDHRQRSERAWLTLQKDIEDQKARSEEENRVRDAAQSSLQMEFTDRQMTRPERAQRVEVERLLHDEFTAMNLKLEKRMAELSNLFDAKQGILQEKMTVLSKDIESFSSSLQEEVRLRTAAEDRLISRSDGLRAEFAEVALKSASINSSNDALRKEMGDLKTFWTDTMKRQLESGNRRESDPQTVCEVEVRQALLSDLEVMNYRFQDQQTTLRSKLENLSHLEDIVQELQERFRCNQDDIVKISSEHRMQHKETRTLMIEEIRSMVQDANGSLKVALAELRKEFEDHRDSLKIHLASQWGLGSESLLSSTVRSLEEKVEELHDLSGEVTQLKLDQEKAQENLNRRLQATTDLLSVSFEQVQTDYETLRRRQGELAMDAWKEEARRLWEAFDRQTHNTTVTNIQETEETEQPANSIMRREAVREAQQSPRVMQAVQRLPIERLGASSVPLPNTASARVLSPISLLGSARVPAEIRALSPKSLPGSAFVPTEVVFRPDALGRSARATGSPLRGGSPSRSSTPLTRSSQMLMSSRQVLSTASLIQPPANMVEPPLALRRSTTASVSSARSSAEVARIGSSTKGETTATVGMAKHEVRSAYSHQTLGSSTIAERTEERTLSPGQAHHHLEAHIGKAVLEQRRDVESI